MYIFMFDDTNVVLDHYDMCKPHPSGYQVGEHEVIAIPDIHPVEVDAVPDDFTAFKYCYTEVDGFTLNPDWKEPEPPIEQKVAALMATIADIDEINVDQEYRLTLLELGLDDTETATGQ